MLLTINKFKNLNKLTLIAAKRFKRLLKYFLTVNILSFFIKYTENIHSLNTMNVFQWKPIFGTVYVENLGFLGQCIKKIWDFWDSA
jgi:hypothetical protein